MFTSHTSLRLTIYSLIALSFFLGLPQFHYAAALMVGLIIRYKDHPAGLFTTVEIPLPRFGDLQFAKVER